jgi:predicted DNA-binding ribbon-helix-helix protein
MRKRSVDVFGKQTSFTLEQEFWDVLELMCAAERVPLYRMIERIAKTRPYKNLSSSIRVRVLQWAFKGWRP